MDVKVILDGWLNWCNYKRDYGHMFETALKIPVPAELERLYFSRGVTFDQVLNGFVDYLRGELHAGRTPAVPPPVPAPPTNLIRRSMAQGATTTSTGQAAWRGFKEEGTRQLKKGLISLLTRRW